MDIVPSNKVIDYSTVFLNFAKKRQLTKIGTSCKGSNREKEMIDKLDMGFECLYFSSNQ